MTKIEKTTFFFTMFMLVAVLVLIVFSKTGILDYKGLKDKELEITQKIDKMNQENEQIKNEIKSLKTDLEYIKHIARHEHEMAAENEFIFKTKPQAKGDTQ